ncbi:MAG: Do family serine endopeptidase, partial [Gammaproteobacteria bacterium]
MQTEQGVPTLAPMIKQVTPAVVNISTKGHVEVQQNPLLNDPFFRHFFNVPEQPQQREYQALGSGVIVDAKNGYILTNNHVIEHADEITVKLNDDREFDAKVIGADPETDVAVIKIDAKNLTQVPLGNSSQLQVGDFVVAIGNPFGLEHTVTSGIVSGLGRVGLNLNDQNSYQDFIQTDASINPGNSGGALVNLRGELVGINTAILSRSGGNIGIGFAIPINMAQTVMNQLIKNGKIERGVLGVSIQNLTPELADALGLKNVTHGAVVGQVTPGSGADKAGIKQGDVIIEANGKKVANLFDLKNVIGLLPVGSRVDLKVIRDGETRSITAT